MADIRISAEFDSAWLAPSGVLDDRYEIQRVLGRGGAAYVLLARDRRYERDVAIKVIKPELSGVVATERFLQEVRITASLQHPHIVPVLDSGESRRLPYYVTPYVPGGSLRDRIEQARQLPLDEALGVAADVAAALQYAHDRGILHRDIKPENILLTGGHAVVADFGLAQALVRASGERLTSTGIVVGTPAYMSPEQASGERVLGPATDVYSLACVIYEMIAGVPPFVGPTVDSVIAQRFRGPPHPLRQYRPTIPESVDAAVARAMCIAPADRFQSPREFSTALGIARGTPAALPAIRLSRQRNRILKLIALLGLLAIVVTGGRWGLEQLNARAAAGSVDPSRYVVLPATGDGGRVISGESAMRHVAAAMHQWRDIRVIEFPDSPPLRRASPTPRDVARSYHAGYYVTTAITGFGDSVQVDAALWNTSLDAASLAERTVRLHRDSVQEEGPWRRIVAALLAPDSASHDQELPDELPGTSSLAAWRSYARGQRALAAWDLARADTSFNAAVGIDPRFAQAQLWLAQVGAWARPDQPATWRDAAGRAVDLSKSLTRRDSLLAIALAALGNNDFPASCAAFRRLRDLMPNDAVPWLGLGQCLAVDGLVVRDLKSPSGWSFRTSWRAAAAAYDSALRRADGAPAFAFQWLSRVLLVDPAWSRDGYGPDSTIFRSYPGLMHDTLAHIPFPTAEFEAGAPRADRSTVAAALRQNAKHLDAAYTDWTRRAPESAAAWETLSFIEEVTGAPEAEEGGGLLALRSNATARHLAKLPAQQLRLAQSAVRLLAKTEQFAAANKLADSVLRAIPRADGTQATWLAGIAALVGRVDRAIELQRAMARARPTAVFGMPAPPPQVLDAAIAYQTIAAAGLCGDTLAEARTRVDQAVDRYVPAQSRDRVRQQVTWRGASLSFPCGDTHVIDGIVAPDRLIAVQRAVAANDRAEFRREMAALDRLRRYYRPGDVATDHIYQEAWLLASVGDSAAAARRLDLNLTALTTVNTHLLEDAPRAFALGRAMVLRADLAAAKGDARTARRWATDVLQLWAGTSGQTDGELARMKRFASTQH